MASGVLLWVLLFASRVVCNLLDDRVAGGATIDSYLKIQSQLRFCCFKMSKNECVSKEKHDDFEFRLR